jgi:single-stranded-DNA-specific exonuclease
MRTAHRIETRPEWIEPDPIPPASNWRELDSSPLVAAILYRRGIATRHEADAFMHPTSGPVPDPFCIPNMKPAVERILRAVQREERIGVFGDYDADGITSTAILVQALRQAMNPQLVTARLPDRTEGYGMNRAAVAEFAETGVSLVIAVDCGSSDHESAATIAGLGMDLVIVDHHHMRDSGPSNAITVSPQLDADPVCHDLTAAGITYLLVRALAAHGLKVSAGHAGADHAGLDLVALGTVADVAPLKGANRVLVARGIAQMRTSPRTGIAAVIESAGLQASSITATNISFALAPRINSAGRMGSPRLAFDLLMTSNGTEARALARELEQVNLRRRSRSAQVLAEAWDSITRHHDWQSRPVFAIENAGWEPGLVGAVASRMMEEARRPILLFREDNGHLSGSARSIDGFNLIDALHDAEPLLTRFGGHSLAAGLSLPREHLAQLESHLGTAMAALDIEVPSPPRIRIDATLPPEYLSLETVRDLSRMEPFGRGNDHPVLRIPKAQLVKYSAMGNDRSHLKIIARAGKRQVEAIGWGAADRSSELVTSREVDLVGRLEINTWNGQDRVQMVLADFRPS